MILQSVRRALASTIGSAVLLLGLARASAAPIATRDADSARLRLSWSARPERIEICRTLSQAELAEREEHMRQRVECDGRFATYMLRVISDGQVVHESVVRGAGLRHDRPIYLLRELRVPSGVHRLRISFERRERVERDTAHLDRSLSSGIDSGVFAGRALREALEHSRTARAAIPAQMVFSGTVEFRSGRVRLVTLDREQGRLQLVDDVNPP